jgi:hypothetical protein
MTDIVEAGGGEALTTIKLVTADGTDRLVQAPLAWLIEATEHTATDREFAYDPDGATALVFRIHDGDGTLVVSDDNGAAAVLPPDRRANVLAELKRRLWATWVEVEVDADEIDESLTQFTETVAEWNRLIPAQFLDTAVVETKAEHDGGDDDDWRGVVRVSFRRPPTPEEQAQRAETARQQAELQEKYDRRELARLGAKYDTKPIDATEPSD